MGESDFMVTKGHAAVRRRGETGTFGVRFLPGRLHTKTGQSLHLTMKALAIFKLALAIVTILSVLATAQAASVITGGNQTIWGCMEAQLEGHYGGGATGAIWSGGGGTFSPNSTNVNAIYTPCAAEIAAGSTTLTLTSLPPGPGQASATMTITILANTIASANGNQTICSCGSTAGLGGGLSTSATNGVWSSSGTGTFAPNATTLNATYTPSAADATAGTVALTLESQPCCVSRAQVMVSIQALPAVNEAPTNLTVCAGSPAVFTVVAAGSNLAYQWQVSQDGGTTFTNISATATNASYTNLAPTLADNGNQYQVVVSSGIAAVTSVPPAVLTVNAPATAGAGPNQTICTGFSTVGLGGTVGGGATGGLWSSSSTGTFVPNATTLNASYALSVADLSAGVVTLTLHATGQLPPCVATANVVVTAQSGFVLPGANQTVCASGTHQLFGSYGGCVTGATWSGGGTFLPNNTTTNAIYTPSAAEIAAGSATLTLTSFPPGSVSSTMTLTFHPQVNAGPNQTVCANTAVHLAGSYGGGATSAMWTGAGTFAPNASQTNAYYTPSAAEISAGSATVTLITSTSTPPPCQPLSATMTISIRPAATAYIGYSGQPVCSGVASAALGGAVGGGATGGTWTSSGTGTFAPNATTLNASYTASTADASTGTVTLTLTTTGQLPPLCPGAAGVVLTVRPPATASAGTAQTVCSGVASAGLGGTVGGGATGGTWTSSGTGTFAPNASTLNANYTASTADASAGTVTLTLTTTGQLSPCSVATATVVVSVRPAATVSSGANQTICAGASAVALGGTVGGGGTGGTWTSSGTGSFAPDTTTLNATYTPSAADITAGMVTLTLSSTGQQAPCGLATAQMVVTVQPWAVLGTTVLLEGPGAGNDSMVLAVNPATTIWTAAANAAWLHLSVANQSGTGSTNVVFSYDANPGATRTGTLTIACQTLTVTQAGSTYVAAPGPVTALVASGLNLPRGVALDRAGNVYFADYTNNAIKEWTAANNTVTTLVASGLNGPIGVAVDGAGNVYIADTGNNAIKEWIAADNTVTTLIASGLNQPWGIAVDGTGNVYIADTLNNAIKKWTAANSNLTTLVASGLNQPRGVAVDGAGNVYIADYLNQSIKEWTAANNTVTTLVSSGLLWPYGVTVDGAGNVFIADTFHNAIKEWRAASNTVTTLVASGSLRPGSVAVDGTGNVYIADGGNNAVKELPRAFVDPTMRWAGPAAGSDVLPVVLPATANLLAPFAPTSDQAWLSITGITNGVVSFAFSANTGSTNRTANITLLGQPISITQAGLGPTLVGSTLLGNGMFQFAFSNNDLGASFTVLTTTNLSLPMSNWTVAGPATNTAPGLFQFSTGTTDTPQGFYRVRSP